jgi:hypothetical protein
MISFNARKLLHREQSSEEEKAAAKAEIIKRKTSK